MKFRITLMNLNIFFHQYKRLETNKLNIIIIFPAIVDVTITSR